MKKRIALTLWAVLAAAAARAADVSEFVPSREIDHLFETGKGPYIPTAVTHNYDVRRYTIAMSIDDAAKTVAATTTVRLASGQAGLTQVAFDFYSGLTVTQVSRAGTPLSFVHQGNVLTITLDRPMAMGEVFELAVAYNGTPGEGM